MAIRGGFTLPETIVVMVIAAALSAAAIYITTRDAAPGSESEAQASLWSAYRTQNTADHTSQAPAGAELLGAIDPTTTYTEGPSEGPGVVSVHVSGTAAHMAVLGTDQTCWVLRYDARPRGSSHVTWGVANKDSGFPCDMREANLRQRMDDISSENHPFARPATIEQ